MSNAGTGVIAAPAPAATAAPSCAAIVVHYRDADATLRCVRSLLAQRPAPTVVVVDNASPDGSGGRVLDALAAEPRVERVRSPRNGGFGAGCNLGIVHALQRWPDLEHLLLLNPDAELDAGGLAELQATQRRHAAAGIVGCDVRGGHGSPWFTNGRIPRWTLSGFHCTRGAADEHRADFVTGACMLLRAELLRAGLRFDERYFLYCEDADLCEQVRRRGGETWVTHRAHARHAGGGSMPGVPVLGELTAERLYWLTRAKVIFASRHLTRLQRWCFLTLALVAKPIAGACVARSLRFLGPYLRGLRDGFRASR